MTDFKQDIDSGSTGAQIAHADNVHIGGDNRSSRGGIPNHLTLLPAKNPNFVGRKVELERIKNDLVKDSMVYIVNGIGGIGKSELAFQYLLNHEADYQHIALFEFSDDTDKLEDILINSLKQSLFLADDITLRGILYRLQNLPEKCLLVFDNLKNKDDIDKLRPLNNNCDVLITTRLNISDHRCLNLDILPIEDARTLFQKHHPTKEKIDDILKYIDYHSLFIELIAKTLQEGCLSLEELREKFHKGEFAQIDRNFEASFNDFLIERFQIEDNEQLKQLLQLLALLPSIEIRTFTLEEMFVDDSRLKLKLNELSKRGWLIEKEGSYKLHQIIKEFIFANHPTDFETACPILENISMQLNPKDIFVNHIEKTHYIEIIESITEIFSNIESAAIASLLDCQCTLYYSLGRYKKALKFQLEALKIRRTIMGEKHPDTATSYDHLAIVYRKQGNYHKAFELEQKALEIRVEVLGEKHPDTAASYDQLAGIYGDQSNFPKALELQQKALKIRIQVLGENHPYTGVSLNNLGLIYSSQGNHTRALTLFQKSLIIQEEVLGAKHPNTATCYNNVALCYHHKKKFSEALENYQKAISLQEEVLGDKHPATSLSYHNLGGFYADQGNFTNALKLYHTTLSIRREAFGDIHPLTASTYECIASSYLEDKYCGKAVKFISKALSIYQDLNLNNEAKISQDLLKRIQKTINKAKKLPLRRRHKICKDLKVEK